VVDGEYSWGSRPSKPRGDLTQSPRGGRPLSPGTNPPLVCPPQRRQILTGGNLPKNVPILLWVLGSQFLHHISFTFTPLTERTNRTPRLPLERDMGVVRGFPLRPSGGSGRAQPPSGDGGARCGNGTPPRGNGDSGKKKRKKKKKEKNKIKKKKRK